MPLTLVAPRQGRSPYWRIRGTYLGRYVDRTTETADRAKARRMLKAVAEKIERGELSSRAELTFAAAALSYVKSGGEPRYLKRIVDYFGPRILAGELTQWRLDDAAIAIWPRHSAATRNRAFYTPVSAILKHAGIDHRIRRPKGAQGEPRTRFLTEGEARRFLAASSAVDAEFGIFIAWLLFTGLRLSEGLRAQCRDFDLQTGWAHIERTKSGKPRSVYLPPQLIAELANHPRGLDRVGRAFRFHRGGRLYRLMRRAKTAAGADLAWLSFHYLRHTYGAWLRRYGGLDTTGLIATGAWQSRQGAARYEHADASEESRRAERFPNVIAAR